MTTKVTGDLYEKLDGKLFEIKRQIRQRDGYTFDPNALDNFLQRVIEGKFAEIGIKWFENDGVIYFTVISNGMTGEEWIKHLKSKGIKIGDCVRQVLLNIIPSKKGTVTQIAVIKGEFFSDGNRTTSNVRIEADKRKLVKPNLEVACLIRDMFTDEEIKTMRLSWIVTMHGPIKDFGGSSDDLLCTARHGDDSWFFSYCDPSLGWGYETGFALVVPQVYK